jgi:hypothetical protein
MLQFTPTQHNTKKFFKNPLSLIIYMCMKDIILSKIKQTQKGKYYMISLTCEILES